MQFNLRPPPAAALGAAEILLPRAEIIWSTEGNSVRRLISIYDGTVISGCAQGFDVKVFDATLNGTGLEYFASALVTPGTRPSIQQPPTLYDNLPILITAAGGVGTFVVPPDAGVISIRPYIAPVNAAAVVGNDDVTLQFQMPTSDIAFVGYDGLFDWIPLPPGTTQIVIRNNRAAGDIAANILWGIEG